MTINLLRTEHRFLGRLACDQGKSIGAVIREQLFAALEAEYPAQIRELKEARRRRQAAILGVVGLWSVILAGLPDSGVDLRRAPRTTSVRIVRRADWFEA